MLKRLARKLGIGKRPRSMDARREQRVQELVAKLRVAMRAKYDAAQTTLDNRKHWAAADSLSATAANSPEVRRILRNRARYELANNGYAEGIGGTLSNDSVGTGPRLQVRTSDKKSNEIVEDLWRRWAQDIDLEGKLWTMRFAKVEDGESFGLLVTNPALHKTPIQLDLRVIEADQVDSPHTTLDPDEVDGIRFDRWGNPVSYSVRRTHPGDLRFPGGPFAEYDAISAGAVLHYFRAKRPGQRRGIPEVTASLPLFGQMRRYTLAVIAAAEVAADLALVLFTDGPADGEPTVQPEAMDTIELEKRLATVLPEGWKLGQPKAEQPTTTYGDFKREILTEIARPLHMPYNVAAGDSSSYNYASGRLDHQTYFRALRLEQSLMRRQVLEPLLMAWLSEAVLIDGLLPQQFRMRDAKVPHVWLWDGHEHVDPSKEASAQETRLRSRTTTLATEFGREGKDWEAELRQQALEKELMDELGLVPVSAAPAPASVPAGEESDDEEAD